MEQLSGTIESITYQNKENGYTVLDLLTGDGDIFTAVGTIGAVYTGEKVTFTGEWAVHSNYGRQFRVESVEREGVNTTEDQYNYLASGQIKGVRVKTAQMIIEKFGENTFDVIRNCPERLATIKGISKKRALEISEDFIMKSSERDIIISLEKYGISPSESLRIFSALGAGAPEIIRRNPYIICDEAIGMSFEKAEQIADMVDGAPDPEYRMTAGIKYVLEHNLSNGHTCVPVEKLYAPCRTLLGDEAGRDEIDKYIAVLNSRKATVTEIINEKQYIFLNELYKAEINCAKELIFRKNFAVSGNKVTDERIERIEVISGICYNPIQKKAIKTAVEQGLLILTGGPGTGKTTTVRAIINLLLDDGIETVLCAPTGRAAKRMSELTGYEAKTIHRLLEVEWDENDKPVFTRNKRNPIEANAVIVDELSMVDVRLFASLLDALPLGCRLIMVGDSDQLPPVGAGNVLQDIISSSIMPVVKLTEVFRQAMESAIVVNAHKIVRGEMPDLTLRDSDFFFMERNTVLAAGETVCELCASRLPKAYGYSPLNDIQVITPSRVGEAGCVSLNARIQSIVNPKSAAKKEFGNSGRIFREGDKVMQIKNNYDLEWKSAADSSTGLGIFNGDIGIIRKIDFGSAVMDIRFDERDVEYPLENASQLDLAYAVTVHKSQGSEFRAVVMPVCGVPEKLAYRNLLYTAVTRAREMLILVGSERTVCAMVENNSKAKRYSALGHFLISENGV